MDQNFFARLQQLKSDPNALRSLAMQPVDPDAVVAHHMAQMANGPAPSVNAFEGLIEPRGPQANLMADGGLNTPGGFDQALRGYTTDLSNSTMAVPPESGSTMLPGAGVGAMPGMMMLGSSLMGLNTPKVAPAPRGAPIFGAAAPAKPPNLLQGPKRSYPIGALLVGR
jgi:hypothetical protein